MAMFLLLVIGLLIVLIVVLKKLRASFNASEILSEAEISTPSSASSPIIIEGSEFDVFLSFRGEDTRKGFTGHLYEGLKLRGVSPFIDSENLKKGEEIPRLLEYIEKSKVCIPIISVGYADSKWCLKELAQIVALKKKVIPVFFGVDASDMKKQSGPFTSGFEKHESNRKLKSEEVRKWREAFAEVGNISGYTLKDVDGYEAKLVQIIVKRILEEVNPYLLHVGEYVIGHEFHFQNIMRLMDMESNDARIIGIHGMGGIGKTTLAKAIYNNISLRFEACSFISYVREASLQFRGLESLQQLLLRDLFKIDEPPITDKDKGIELIKEKISTKKVLIILDDIDNKDQLLALVPSREWFRKESRIIVTTRDTNPLISWGMKRDEIYELTELDHDNSIKLFCYHAFGSDKPSISKEYANMCDEAVSSITGLPLALKVLGSQFFDLNTEKEWRDLLAKLKESQHKKIFEKLKLSYESLDDNEKYVFLDIACFFLGKHNEKYDWFGENRWWEVDEVKRFWEECRFFPEHAINVLQHKSLIKIVKWDDRYDDSLEARLGRWRFEMHDQIRDMGRKIVEDDEEKEKPCNRLWKYDDPKVRRALRRQGVSIIEGIMFHAEKDKARTIALSLQDMDDLRLFHVNGGNFDDFPYFPEGLKWLGLPCCQHYHNAPTATASIPRDHLVVLDLYKNDHVASFLLKESISRSMQIFRKLKIIDLSCTGINVTPDFTSIPCLVKLTLIKCKELVEVHESVGKLKSLVWLNLRGCKKLRELPDAICNLTSLEFLSLENCVSLFRLPKDFGNLTSLKHLDLRIDTFNAISLPNSMRKLCDLENMLIENNIRGIYSSGLDDMCLVAESKLICLSASNIEVLPDPCCKKKTQLQLSDNVVEDLTDESLRRWKNIESLILDCRSLKSFPARVGQLQKLKLLEVYSSNLTLVDDALPLETLEKLVLECAVLEHASSLVKRKPENLKHLTLKCKKMENVPDWIGSSNKLETLKLSGCNTSPRIVSVFNKLNVLELELDSSPMTVTPNFIGFHCLEKLTIMNCKELIEVHQSIGILKKLKFLKITGCTMLERLPESICELGSLESLDLKGCIRLSSLPEGWADQLYLLEVLCLDETGIVSLPALRGKLKRLRSLSIKNCQFLKDTPESFISYLEYLIELHVIDSHLEGMPENNYFKLGSAGSLRASTSWEFMDALPFSCCQSVSELFFTNGRIEKLTNSIARFRNVESMSLKCKMLKVLPDSIEQLKNLKHLTLQCHTFTLFDRIHLPESIESLKVECIKFLPPSFPSTTLGPSTASGCENVKEKAPVTRQFGCFSQMMQNLKRLELCTQQITVTPDFSFAPCLEKLILKDCEMLVEVHGSIGTLNNLRSLKIIGCNVLEGLPDTICHLTSLEKLKLTQEFNLSSSLEPSRDSEKLGLCMTGIKRILSSIRQLTQLRELHLQKSSPTCRGFEGMYWGSYGKKMEISGSCLELVMDDQIEELPEYIIRQMKKLEALVFNCKSLKALPKWIGQLKQLYTLEVDCDDISIFFDEMWARENIESIRTLRLGCKNIKRLPDSVRQLKNLGSLDLSKTGILEFPPWFGCLTNLTRLTLRNMITHQNDGLLLLSGLSQLTSLTYLDLSENSFESLPSCISNFSRLQVVDVSGCKQLHSIPHLSSSVLEKFRASNCINLRVMPDFSNLRSLKLLYLGGCNSLDSIPGFQIIAESVQHLELPGPSGGIQSSNLSDYFKNKVFMSTFFQRLQRFKMGGNLFAGSHKGQQCLSFLFPNIRFNCMNLSLVKLTLAGISSPIKIAVIMEDDSVLFETMITEDDFDSNDEDHSKTFSFGEEYEEIFEHLGKGSQTMLVWTDASKLTKVELEAELEWDLWGQQ